MPKGSPELTRARRDEIIAACAKLYETMSFKEITMREIAEFTSFTRPSLYNYFQTKEEIFLALFQMEYEEWTADLDRLQPEGKSEAKWELADQVARTLARRERLLKLLSSNLSDMEMNSRLENLVEFKRAYGASIEALHRCMTRFCPEMTPDRVHDVLGSFLPLVYGIYPYAVATDKQKAAMREAGIPYQPRSIYDLAFLGMKQLLGT